SSACRTTRSLLILRVEHSVSPIISHFSFIVTLASTAGRTARRRSHLNYCSRTHSSTTRRRALGTHSTTRVFTTPSTFSLLPSSYSSLSSLPNSYLESSNR
ncbi:hypothetical protein PMAYCL1PPCAC_16261, partial [Pristionchus mayeri]